MRPTAPSDAQSAAQSTAYSAHGSQQDIDDAQRWLNDNLHNYEQDYWAPSQDIFTSSEASSQLPYGPLSLSQSQMSKSRRIDGTKTFEQVIAETTRPLAKLPFVLERTPLCVALNEGDLTMLAAACRFAAQFNDASKQDMSALAETLLVLKELPESQRPANARRCELKWVSGADTFVLSPKLLRDYNSDGDK